MKRYLKTLLPLFCLLAFIIIGLAIYKDYGIPWDEADQIRFGVANYNYILKGSNELLSSPNRYYGSLYETALLWLTAHLPIARHLLIFLTFVAGLVCFYFLGRRLLSNSWWALLATVLLAVSPRIFADAFYNSKDIPFMVAAIVAIWTLVLLADFLKQTHRWLSIASMVALHALASAVLIGTRVPGIMIVPLSFFLILIGVFKNSSSWKKRISALGEYLFLTIGLTILIWPILWRDPWGEFVNAFQSMSRFPFTRPVLYMGQFYSPRDLPWHYLPVWIGITTPLVVLLGVIPGLCAWVEGLGISMWRRKRGSDEKKQVIVDQWAWSVIIGWLAIPIVAVYWFDSVLYDSWRQMFFVYPAIVLISVYGLKVVFAGFFRLVASAGWLRLTVGCILLVGLAEPIWFIAHYHPHENVYFNVLAGNPTSLRERFELDYWGLSYKQAIDYILAHDPRSVIKIAVANPPGLDYINGGLAASQKSRLVPVKDPGVADYFVSEFRWHPEDYPYPDEYYAIDVRGTTIMSVYRFP
jgi:hypothetical protein